MNAIQVATAEIVTLLAEGSYDAIETLTQGRRLSATDLRTAVETYGRTLRPLPPSELTNLDVVPVKNAMVPTVTATVDLWTEEEGHSDLTLELLLSHQHDDAYAIEVLDLRVL